MLQIDSLSGFVKELLVTGLAILLDIYLTVLVFLIVMVFCLSDRAIILKMVGRATSITAALIVVELGRGM